jgi:hypothetical protein
MQMTYRSELADNFTDVATARQRLFTCIEASTISTGDIRHSGTARRADRSWAAGRHAVG